MSGPVPFAPPFSFGGPFSGTATSPLASPSNGGFVGLNLELPLPQVFPIPSAQIFNAEGDVSSVAIETGVLIPLVPGIDGGVQIPDNSFCVLNAVSIYITDMLDTSDVRWTVYFNNNPLPGYTNLRIFPRTAPYVGNTFDAPVFPINGPGSLIVRYNNADGGSYRIGAALSGWYWSTSADAAWKQQGQGL